MALQTQFGKIICGNSKRSQKLAGETSARLTATKVIAWLNINIKSNTATTEAMAQKARISAPQQGYITLGPGPGRREEIADSDSLLLIIDVADYLFIHLSPALSFPLSAWSDF